MSGLHVVGLAISVIVSTLVLFGLLHRDATLGFIARWGVPIMMTLAYITLAITSDVDSTGMAWMTIGLGFVFVVWWIFRLLTTRAALSRAIAVGDADRILELATKQLAQRHTPIKRAPFMIPRAFAYEIRGDWPAVLAELDAIDRATLAGADMTKLRQAAATIRVAALVELGEIAPARAVLDGEWVRSPAVVTGPNHGRATLEALPAVLAHGRVLVGEGAHEEAQAALRRVTETILATPMQRATAHHYLARALHDNAGAATKHRTEAHRFAPPMSWLATQNAPENAKPT